MDYWSCKRCKFFQQELLEKEFNKLISYIENANLGVDSDHYLEICAALGSEPDEDEIPPTIDDLCYEAQMALEIYAYLQDIWSGGMTTFYVGKSLQNLKDIFDLFDILEGSRLYILQFILAIDKETAKSINNRNKALNGK